MEQTGQIELETTKDLKNPKKQRPEFIHDKDGFYKRWERDMFLEGMGEVLIPLPFASLALAFIVPPIALVTGGIFVAGSATCGIYTICKKVNERKNKKIAKRLFNAINNENTEEIGKVLNEIENMNEYNRKYILNNVLNESGDTALITIIKSNMDEDKKIEILDRLIANGADVNEKNVDGKTPLEIAESLGKSGNTSKLIEFLNKEVMERKKQIEKENRAREKVKNEKNIEIEEKEIAEMEKQSCKEEKKVKKMSKKYDDYVKNIDKVNKELKEKMKEIESKEKKINEIGEKIEIAKSNNNKKRVKELTKEKKKMEKQAKKLKKEADKLNKKYKKEKEKMSKIEENKKSFEDKKKEIEERKKINRERRIKIQKNDSNQDEVSVDEIKSVDDSRNLSSPML